MSSRFFRDCGILICIQEAMTSPVVLAVQMLVVLVGMSVVELELETERELELEVELVVEVEAPRALDYETENPREVVVVVVVVADARRWKGVMVRRVKFHLCNLILPPYS